jgi:aminopeptidase N
MLAFLSDSLQKEDKIRALAREIAHQWWYAIVGNNALENAWQDEGLAEYSALCFLDGATKYGVSRDTAVAEHLKEYRGYYDVYGSVLGRADTRMQRHLKEFVSEYEYACIARRKPVVMFDTLRKSVGDKKFFGALKRYYSTCKFKTATPHDLIGAFEKTGLDARGFFESFLDGKAIL